MKTQNNIPWWQKAVIYHIYPFSFYDSNNDGIGDLSGIIQRLNYLNNRTHKSLGVDAVWITPVSPSPWADYGYDVADYTAIDPVFGSMKIAEKLIWECHARNIKVIFDFVPNHTSSEHPWFIESKSSRDSQKHDWYIWADPNPQGGVPTAHRSIFGGSAWEFNHRRGQYYFHYFYKEQPDLNWCNAAVRKAMEEALVFWLDKGVDGFRFDAVKHLYEKFLDIGRAGFPVRTLDKKEAHEVFKGWRKILDHYGGVAIGEAWETNISEWASYYGKNLDEFHLPLNFFFMDTRWDAGNIRRLVDSVEAGLPRGAWLNWAIGNHDISRFVSRYGSQFVRLGAMLLLTLRGTPILYYGDEIGMSDVSIAPDRVRDRFGRDRARTPMQWDESPHAGFTQVEPWLPVGDSREISVVAQGHNPDSLLSLYKKLIWLRKRNAALRLGDYKSLDTASLQCFAYLRTRGKKKVLVILNFSSDDQKPGDCAGSGRGKILLSTDVTREKAEVEFKDLILAPYEGCIVDINTE